MTTETSLVVRCADVVATKAVAAALVPLVRAGDTLLLVGELGAGKTAFTQGLAAAAGVTEPVTSPTFTLMRHHPTAVGPVLLHVDVYRLETTAEIADLGLGELLEDGAFAVIEWGDRAIPVIGPDHLEIGFSRVDDDRSAADERDLWLHTSAPSWSDRWGALRSAVVAIPGVTPSPAPNLHARPAPCDPRPSEPAGPRS